MEFAITVLAIEPTAARCMLATFREAAEQYPDNPLFAVLAEQLAPIAEGAGAHTIILDLSDATTHHCHHLTIALRVLQEGFVSRGHRIAVGFCFLIIDCLFRETCSRFNHFPKPFTAH